MPARPDLASAVRVAALAATAAAVLIAPPPVRAAGGDYRTTEAYKKLLAIEDGVHSRSAAIAVAVHKGGFPSFNFNLEGMLYQREPDQTKVVFDKVPFLLRGFIKASPSLAPAAAWPQDYSVDVVGDAAGVTTFALRALDADAKTATVDVAVDDASGEERTLRFTDRDGGITSTVNRYATIDGHPVITAQTGSTSGKSVATTFVTTFTNCKFNVPIPDGTFDRPSKK